jgi:hypothetical protein
MRILLAVAAALLVACGSTGAAGGCTTLSRADVLGQGEACGTTGHLSERIATDLRTYSPGAIVVITVTATNTSSEGCAAPTACPPLPVVIDDASGRQAWTTPNVRRPCPAMARLLMPGESVTYTARTDGLTLPVGTYSATGNETSAAAYGRAYFTVC